MKRALLPRLDRLVTRVSDGRTNVTSMLTGLPVILLTTTGARSGKLRSTPLIAIPDGRKLALIASNWGQRRNPAWYYNLSANPQATVTAGGEALVYTAREATPKEYEKYWRWAVRQYPGYEHYADSRGDRRIPIMVLTRQEGSPRDPIPVAAN